MSLFERIMNYICPTQLQPPPQTHLDWSAKTLVCKGTQLVHPLDPSGCIHASGGIGVSNADPNCVLPLWSIVYITNQFYYVDVVYPRDGDTYSPKECLFPMTQQKNRNLIGSGKFGGTMIFRWASANSYYNAYSRVIPLCVLPRVTMCRPSNRISSISPDVELDD